MKSNNQTPLANSSRKAKWPFSFAGIAVLYFFISTLPVYTREIRLIFSPTETIEANVFDYFKGRGKGSGFHVNYQFSVLGQNFNGPPDQPAVPEDVYVSAMQSKKIQVVYLTSNPTINRPSEQTFYSIISTTILVLIYLLICASYLSTSQHHQYFKVRNPPDEN